MKKDYHRGKLVRLPSDVSDRAVEYAERTGQPVAQVVGEAVSEYLARYPLMWDEQAAAWVSA